MLNKFIQVFKLLKSQKFVLDSYSRLQDLDRVGDINSVFNKYKGIDENSKTLDIGCGTDPRNPFKAKECFGLDIRANESKNIKYADLFTDKIPYDDNSFDYLTAFDFIEHVPRVLYCPALRFCFVELMNEVYRVLKPGGIFLSHTPIFPFPASQQDPTHVNLITEDTFPKYFDDSSRFASMYGFTGSFKVEDQLLSPPYLISVLRKN
jgi:SAM-dependent methyltransferase